MVNGKVLERGVIDSIIIVVESHGIIATKLKLEGVLKIHYFKKKGNNFGGLFTCQYEFYPSCIDFLHLQSTCP